MGYVLVLGTSMFVWILVLGASAILWIPIKLKEIMINDMNQDVWFYSFRP